MSRPVLFLDDGGVMSPPANERHAHIRRLAELPRLLAASERVAGFTAGL